MKKKGQRLGYLRPAAPLPGSLARVGSIAVAGIYVQPQSWPCKEQSCIPDLSLEMVAFCPLQDHIHLNCFQVQWPGESKVVTNGGETAWACTLFIWGVSN